MNALSSGAAFVAGVAVTVAFFQGSHSSRGTHPGMPSTNPKPQVTFSNTPIPRPPITPEVSAHLTFLAATHARDGITGNQCELPPNLQPHRETSYSLSDAFGSTLNIYIPSAMPLGAP